MLITLKHITSHWAWPDVHLRRIVESGAEGEGVEDIMEQWRSGTGKGNDQVDLSVSCDR